MDAILCFLFIASSRFAFRLFRYVLPGSAASEGRRVIIYGAGDGGEMVLRELRNNPGLNLSAVGFIDDDQLKVGKMIHGLPVLGAGGQLEEICRQHDAQEVLISFRDMPSDRLRELRAICQDADISLRRAMFVIETVESD